MKKFLRNLFIIIYAIIAIFVTICLLSYNDFKISDFGDYSFVIVKDDSYEGFTKGDLIIIDESKSVKVGDSIFYYNTYSKYIGVAITQIEGEEKLSEDETTYSISGGKLISSEYVMGPVSQVKTISKVGTILRILESKWGFLFLIVFPSFIAFLYEIYELVVEVKRIKKNERKNDENK